MKHQDQTTITAPHHSPIRQTQNHPTPPFPNSLCHQFTHQPHGITNQPITISKFPNLQKPVHKPSARDHLIPHCLAAAPIHHLWTPTTSSQPVLNFCYTRCPATVITKQNHWLLKEDEPREKEEERR
ncbi:hypothetical protein M0R45_006797 [Rubus argutus]|uniref:Uncharacterized protein n=1 Tax=Rubus argutus TaxID=59490 RepID=A0AAW1YRK3_RUBAR